jgi:hypothetical protein
MIYLEIIAMEPDGDFRRHGPDVMNALDVIDMGVRQEDRLQ